MKAKLAIAAALFAALPLSVALAAGNGPLGGGADDYQQVETLHVGPGYDYEVLATIRLGTSPQLKFCQYQGRWCYGSYGRWNGWFYGGENVTNRWTLRYLLGK